MVPAAILASEEGESLGELGLSCTLCVYQVLKPNQYKFKRVHINIEIYK